MKHEYGGIEIRAFPVEELRLETRGTEAMMRGLAVPYNKKSEDLGGFTEIIGSGAAREDVEGKSPIAMLWQHDQTHPISKTTARVSPLVLTETDRGVEFEQPARSLTAEQRQRIEDGVVDQMSFGFRVMKQEHEKWEQVAAGRYLRTVLKMKLLEISPVTFPAYRSTKVAVRCAAAHGITLPEVVLAMPDEAAAFLREQEQRLELALLGESR